MHHGIGAPHRGGASEEGGLAANGGSWGPTLLVHHAYVVALHASSSLPYASTQFNRSGGSWTGSRAVRRALTALSICICEIFQAMTGAPERFNSAKSQTVRFTTQLKVKNSGLLGTHQKQLVTTLTDP